MPIYLYKAKTSPDSFKNGTIEAESEKAALNKLRLLNYYPVSITPKTAEKTGKLRFTKKIKVKDIYVFLRQLSNLNMAGLPLVKSLRNISEQTNNELLRQVITDVRENIQKGSPLSDSLQKHSAIFSALEINMIRSAETMGTLAEVLSEIAELKEKEMEFNSRIRSALAYPVLLISVGVITLFLLASFVLPKFVALFNDLGQELPVLTNILISGSLFLNKYWFFVLGVIIVSAFLFVKHISGKKGRLWFDELKFKVPFLKVITLKIQTSRFSRTLASLIKNGVPIISSLKIVGDISSNKFFAQEIGQMYLLVSKGQSISQAIKSSQIFEKNVVDLISVGEESGMLEEMLLKIADINENESKQLIEAFLFMLEPILILSLGAVIGIIVLAILLPVFEMNFLVQ